MKAAHIVTNSIPLKKWRQIITRKISNDNQDGVKPESVTVNSKENNNKELESDNEDNAIQLDFGEQSKSYYKQILYQAINNDADAQLTMGKFYLSGKYVKKNLVIGVEWLIKSSEECNKDATIILSECLRRNKGITEDNRAKVIWCINTSQRIKKQKSQEKRLLYHINHGRKITDDNEFILATSSSINPSTMSPRIPSGEILSLKDIADAFKAVRRTSTNRFRQIDPNSHIRHNSQSPDSTNVTDIKSMQYRVEKQSNSERNEISPNQRNPLLRVSETQTSGSYNDDNMEYQQGGNPFEGLDDDMDDDDDEGHSIPGNPFLDFNSDTEDISVSSSDEQSHEKTKDSVFNPSTTDLLEDYDVDDFLHVAFGSDDEETNLTDTNEYQSSANTMLSRVTNKISSVVNKLHPHKNQSSNSISATPISSRNSSTTSLELTSSLHQNSHSGRVDINIDSTSSLLQQSLDMQSEKLSNSAHDLRLDHIERPQIRERGHTFSNMDEAKFRKGNTSNVHQDQAMIESSISAIHLHDVNNDHHQVVDDKLANPFETETEKSSYTQPTNPFEVESSVNVGATSLLYKDSSGNASTESLEWTNTDALDQHSHPGLVDANIDSASIQSEQSLDTQDTKPSNSRHFTRLNRTKRLKIRKRGNTGGVTSSVDQANTGCSILTTDSHYSDDINDTFHHVTDDKPGNPFEIENSMNVSATPLSYGDSSRNSSTASLEGTNTATLDQHSHADPVDSNIDSTSIQPEQSLDIQNGKLLNNRHFIRLRRTLRLHMRERGDTFSNKDKPKSITSSIDQDQADISSSMETTDSHCSNNVNDDLHHVIDNKPGNPFETEFKNPPGNPFEIPLFGSQQGNKTVTNVGKDEPDQSLQYDHLSSYHQQSSLNIPNKLIKSNSAENLDITTSLHQSGNNSKGEIEGNVSTDQRRSTFGLDKFVTLKWLHIHRDKKGASPQRDHNTIPKMNSNFKPLRGQLRRSSSTGS